MRTAAATIVLALLSLAATSRAESGESHVKVDLLADTTAVQPGKPFTLGVRFKIDPGWHIYWTNPGDSGLPTRVKVHVPQALMAGDVRYPSPTVLRLPGGIVNYGYEAEVMLLVPVVVPVRFPPADGPVTSVRISFDADFLVCSENCIPGKVSGFLTLPIADKSEPANARAFEASQARLPRDIGYEDNVAKYRIRSNGGRPDAITITWSHVPSRANEFEWIPPSVQNGWVSDVDVSTKGNETTVSYEVHLKGATELFEPRAVGLLVLHQSDGHIVGLETPIRLDMAPGESRSPVSGK